MDTKVKQFFQEIREEIREEIIPEIIPEIQQQIQQQIGQILKKRSGSGSPSPSPTPSTLGRQAVKDLEDYGGIQDVTEYIRTSSTGKNPNPTAGKSPPFLADGEWEELQKEKFENESDLIKWFEPRFRALMTETSKELGHKVILLNTERHGWVKDPVLGEASKPDGVCLPVEMVTFSMTPTDKQHANDGDTNFGVLAHWDLRDSIEFICEWKLGNRNLNREAIEYARRIKSSFKSDCNVAETKRTIDMLIANRAGFQLARCVRGDVAAVVHGKWNSVGSKQALERFALGTLWKVPRQRPWMDALKCLTDLLEVELVEPVTHADCFLGRGASGRVFRVRKKSDNDHPELALKVALGADGVSRLCEEAYNMNMYANKLQQAGVTTTKHGGRFLKQQQIGALLTGPIGIPIKRIKKHFMAALKSLKQLNEKWLAHGDARWPNVIIIEEDGDTSSLKALWIDLRTLEEVYKVEDKNSRFVQDVMVFFSSFHIDKPTDQKLKVLIKNYLADDNALNALLDATRSIWDSKNNFNDKRIVKDDDGDEDDEEDNDDDEKKPAAFAVSAASKSAAPEKGNATAAYSNDDKWVAMGDDDKINDRDDDSDSDSNDSEHESKTTNDRREKRLKTEN